ncbi:Myosin-5, partial [Frankliniella fusca]
HCPQPKCLWSGLLGSSSEESGERWLRDTTSLRSRDSRVRRFLWTDKDVCDWMCRDDYGSEVRDICRRCCPGSAASTRPWPRPQTAATASASDQQSRAPRTTAAAEATTAPASASTGTPTGTPTGTTAGTSAASSSTTAAAAITTAAAAGRK